MPSQDTIAASERLTEAMQESERLKKKRTIHKLALYGANGLAPANLTLPDREKMMRTLVKTNTDIKVCDKEMTELVDKILND
ncbi:hypothetical protein N0V84_000763 [Fusarium piperis]|uniref:Uncharacterized protein n=1 Tax=Fusarium piperis TaxID=1435070 RepID=A0A9W9BTY7_9HYPO|nr:hypothetical protein N0V84_000763 [Fusarium piperis]